VDKQVPHRQPASGVLVPPLPNQTEERFDVGCEDDDEQAPMPGNSVQDEEPRQ